MQSLVRLSRHTHTEMATSQPKYGQIFNCGLTIPIVSLFSLWPLRNATQLRSGAVDKSKWPIFLRNASENPAYNANTPPHPGMKLWSTNDVLKSWDHECQKGGSGRTFPTGIWYFSMNFPAEKRFSLSFELVKWNFITVGQSLEKNPSDVQCALHPKRLDVPNLSFVAPFGKLGLFLIPSVSKSATV